MAGMEEYWNVKYSRRFCIGRINFLSIEIDTANIPMEKRDLIEAATEAYFNQVREIVREN